MKSQALLSWIHIAALFFALIALGCAIGVFDPSPRTHFNELPERTSPEGSVKIREPDLAFQEEISVLPVPAEPKPALMPRPAFFELRARRMKQEQVVAEAQASEIDDQGASNLVPRVASVDANAMDPMIQPVGSRPDAIQSIRPESDVSGGVLYVGEPQPSNRSLGPQWLQGEGFIVAWDGNRCITAGQISDSYEITQALSTRPISDLSTGALALASYSEGASGVEEYEDSDFWESEQDSSNTGGGSGSGGGSGTGGKQPDAIGVPPPRPQPQFLRDTSVLLDPGEYQFEYGLSYTTNLQTTAIGLNVNDNTVVTSLRTLVRTTTIPMEFRVGCRNDVQAFVSMPIGFNSQQITIATTADTSDGLGIGDLSFGCTKVLRKPQPERFTILGNLSASAPTGLAQTSNIQQVPGVALGSGYWTLAGGMVFIRTIDPIAAYVGLNYVQTFETTLNGLDLEPGNIFSYRFGLGYAINSRVSISSSFNGAYISELEVAGRTLPGSAREPLTVRLAATILSKGPSLVGASKGRRKTTEPFIAMGITDAAPDTSFGVRWTY